MSSESKPGPGLSELLERGEISPEAYAEYVSMADASPLLSTNSSPLARQAAISIGQTMSTPTFSVWGNFALTQRDGEHPIARRVRVACIASTLAHVDRFWQAGIDAGFTDDGHAGPRPDYADDYYAAFIKGLAGNRFEAVYRDGERPRGSIDHVASRVRVVEAATTFYSGSRPHDPA